MRRQIAVFLVAVLVLPQLVAAQTLTPGSRVRVTDPFEGTRAGTLVALTADTLEVRVAGRSESSRLPLAEVTRLEVSRGKQRHISRAGKGLAIGVGVGAVAGFIAGEDDCRNEWLCITRPQGAVLGGAFFGAVGGAIGLLTGVIPSETWEKVPLEGRRVSLVAPSFGRGVGLRIAF